MKVTKVGPEVLVLGRPRVIAVDRFRDLARRRGDVIEVGGTGALGSQGEHGGALRGVGVQRITGVGPFYGRQAGVSISSD